MGPWLETIRYKRIGHGPKLQAHLAGLLPGDLASGFKRLPRRVGPEPLPSTAPGTCAGTPPPGQRGIPCPGTSRNRRRSSPCREGRSERPAGDRSGTPPLPGHVIRSIQGRLRADPPGAETGAGPIGRAAAREGGCDLLVFFLMRRSWRRRLHPLRLVAKLRDALPNIFDGQRPSKAKPMQQKWPRLFDCYSA